MARKTAETGEQEGYALGVIVANKGPKGSVGANINVANKALIRIQESHQRGTHSQKDFNHGFERGKASAN